MLKYHQTTLYYSMMQAMPPFGVICNRNGINLKRLKYITLQHYVVYAMIFKFPVNNNNNFICLKFTQMQIVRYNTMYIFLTHYNTSSITLSQIMGAILSAFTYPKEKPVRLCCGQIFQLTIMSCDKPLIFIFVDIVLVSVRLTVSHLEHIKGGTTPMEIIHMPHKCTFYERMVYVFHQSL